MTYIVSGGALNATHSLTVLLHNLLQSRSWLGFRRTRWPLSRNLAARSVVRCCRTVVRLFADKRDGQRRCSGKHSVVEGERRRQLAESRRAVVCRCAFAETKIGVVVESTARLRRLFRWELFRLLSAYVETARLKFQFLRWNFPKNFTARFLNFRSMISKHEDYFLFTHCASQILAKVANYLPFNF